MRTVNSPFDSIEKLQNSVIQHGPSSSRIYLMKLKKEDHPSIIPALLELAATNHYGKIFAKIPAWAEKEFLSQGFHREASVPGFYNTETDALFMAHFLTKERASVGADMQAVIEENITLSQRKSTLAQRDVAAEAPPFALRRLTPDDADALTKLYGMVFESYPFPIFEREYIIHTMDIDSIAYYGAFNAAGKLVAASSAEIDKVSFNAEMTDFATHPDSRGYSIALHLLRLMEDDMKKRGLKVLYTIARALSAGMNVTFGRAGYEFTGTLINNTNISGSIESMNVWYKRL